MRLRTFIIFSVVVLNTVLIAAASPARADDTCPNGKLCVWSQSDFTGAKQTETIVPAECVEITLSGGAKSAKSRVSSTILFYPGTLCARGGTVLPTAILLPETENANFPASYSFLSTTP